MAHETRNRVAVNDRAEIDLLVRGHRYRFLFKVTQLAEFERVVNRFAADPELNLNFDDAEMVVDAALAAVASWGLAQKEFEE